MSSATKRILAMSLKRLLVQMPLKDITIQLLVSDAEVSRKTFYYHFQDIYDLLEWCLVDEGKRILEGHTTADTWQQGLRSMFHYFQENRVMILNIYRSLHKDSELLEEHVSRMVQPILEQIFNAQPDSERVTEEDRQFILELYSFGLVKLFMHWVGSGMKTDTEYMMNKIDRLFSGSMESLIRRCIEM